MLEVSEKEYSLFLDKLENNEYFSLMSYADGELSFIFDRLSVSPREVYTPDCREELINALDVCKLSNCYLATIKRPGRIYQRIVKQGKKLFKEKGLHEKDFFDSNLFYSVLMRGKLLPLIEIFRERRVVIIGSNPLRKLNDSFFEYAKFIEVPRKRATLERERVLKEILDFGKPAIYAFSAGIVSNILISKVHGKIKNSFFLDLGSIWDAFLGIEFKGWLLKELDDSIMKKNLGL